MVDSIVVKFSTDTLGNKLAVDCINIVNHLVQTEDPPTIGSINKKDIKQFCFPPILKIPLANLSASLDGQSMVVLT